MLLYRLSKSTAGGAFFGPKVSSKDFLYHRIHVGSDDLVDRGNLGTALVLWLTFFRVLELVYSVLAKGNEETAKAVVAVEH